MFLLLHTLHTSNILIVLFHAKFPLVVYVARQNNTPDRRKAPVCKTNTLLWQLKDTDASSTFVTTAGLIVTTPPVRCLLCPLSSAHASLVPVLHHSHSLQSTWRVRQSITFRRRKLKPGNSLEAVNTGAECCFP